MLIEMKKTADIGYAASKFEKQEKMQFNYHKIIAICYIIVTVRILCQKMLKKVLQM